MCCYSGRMYCLQRPVSLSGLYRALSSCSGRYLRLSASRYAMESKVPGQILFAYAIRTRYFFSFRVTTCISIGFAK